MSDVENMMDENIITLTDEDGNDFEFELCASLEYEGKNYVVLLPVDDDEGEVVILEAIGLADAADDEEVTFADVEDEETMQAVFELFREQAGDDFDFED